MLLKEFIKSDITNDNVKNAKTVELNTQIVSDFSSIQTLKTIQ